MNLKSFLKVVLPLALGIFFVYLSVGITTTKDREMIIQSIRNADMKFVFIGLVFSLLSHLSRAYRWRFLLSPMGYRPKLINSILCVLIAYLANMGVPRSGEVIRASFMSNYEKIPFEKAFGSIVIERIIDVIMLFTIILIALILQFDTIWSFILQNNINFKKLLLFGILSVTFFVTLFFITKNSKSQLMIKFKSLISGFWEGVVSIKKMEKKIPFIFHTLFIWLMYLAMFYVIKWSIPGTFGLTIEMIIPVFVVGGLSIATTNGGIGIFPLSVALVLSLFDISKDVGLAFGWIMWSSQTILIIICGSFAFIALPIVNRKNKPIKI